MNIEDIKTGDSLLTVDYKSFVSKIIVKVMRKYAKQCGKDPKVTLSHAARFAWIAGELYVYGSVDSGYKPWLFRSHYSFTNPNEGIIIQRRVTPLTPEEENATINFMQHLVALSFLYEFWALLQWLLLVYLKWDTFSLDSNKTGYCYEDELKCRKNLDPDKYGDTFKVPFLTLYEDPNYSVIYSNIK